MAFSAAQFYIAALLFLAPLLNYLDRQILSALAPILRTQISLTEMPYAMAVNAFLLARAFMYAGSSLLLDRIGTRLGVGLAVAFWSWASGLHGTIRSFVDLLVFRFLLSVLDSGLLGLIQGFQL